MSYEKQDDKRPVNRSGDHFFVILRASSSYVIKGMAKQLRPGTRGRPRKGASVMMQPIMIRFPPEMLAEIDGMLADRLDNPDRSGFIRELIAEAITARRKAGK